MGLAVVLLASPAAEAVTGACTVSFLPAPEAGGFDLEAYLGQPDGWPALSDSFPDGWSLAYYAASSPDGWGRPFIVRGGGPAVRDGLVHPRLAPALSEMLPARRSGLVSMLSAPDSAACFPGKPHPYPLYRDGWLFVHGGYLSIEEITTTLWNADLGPDWEAFKVQHPRDYNGNGEVTRGNAGEICFLALLFELSRVPGDVPCAFRRVLLKLSLMPSWPDAGLHALLMGPEEIWALRYANQSTSDRPLFFTLSTQGDYCLADTLPPPGGGVTWQEIPNLSLAHFPSHETVEILALQLSGDLGPRPEPAGVYLDVGASPARGDLRLTVEAPVAGRLELWDIQGRRLAWDRLPAGRRQVRWMLPADLPSGLLLARLRAGGRETHQRILYLR